MGIAFASRANFMPDSELTYEMMMSLDENVQSRRITVAEKSATTPEGSSSTSEFTPQEQEKAEEEIRTEDCNPERENSGEREESLI